jgi:hypothetical protein
MGISIIQSKNLRKFDLLMEFEILSEKLKSVEGHQELISENILENCKDVIRAAVENGDLHALRFLRNFVTRSEGQTQFRYFPFNSSSETPTYSNLSFILLHWTLR